LEAILNDPAQLEDWIRGMTNAANDLEQNPRYGRGTFQATITAETLQRMSARHKESGTYSAERHANYYRTLEAWREVSGPLHDREHLMTEWLASFED